MSYSQDQFQAAMRAAQKHLTDVTEDHRSKVRRIEWGPGDKLIIYGEFDLGELITAALDAAHA